MVKVQDKGIDCEDPRVWQHDRLASIGLMTAGLVHELQNQVGGILLFAQAIERNELSSEVLDSVQEIEKASLRSKALIRDFLGFLRPGSSLYQLKGLHPKSESACDTDVGAAIEDAWRIASLGLNRAEVEFSVKLGDQQIAPKMPKDQLVQVFLNLFVNACEAMHPEGGELGVRFMPGRTSDQHLGVWEVSDTGPGIPQEVLKNIFQPFFTSKGIGKGTGLGLVICRQLCRNFGGDLTCESQQQAGAVFRIILPLKK